MRWPIPAAHSRSGPRADLCMSLYGGYAMRTFDLAPLYRSTVGFDRLFSMLDNAAGFDAAPGYPPYNIERTGDNAYRISVAVAGFADNELSIESSLSAKPATATRSEEHTSELQSHVNLVCRLLLEK